MMCPVRLGSLKLLLCCLCDNGVMLDAATRLTLEESVRVIS